MASQSEKSRMEKRKEARKGKKTKNHQARIQYQKAKPSYAKSKKSKSSSEKNRQASRLDNDFERERTVEKKSTKGSDDAELEWDSPIEDAVDSPKIVASKKGSKKGKKTNFEKFIELDAQCAAIAAEEDLELERRLAKKLKVKSGKLRGDDDGFNVLFDGLSSTIDSVEGKEDDEVPLKKSRKSSAKKKRKAESSLDEERQVVESKSDSMVELSDPLVAYDSDEALEDVPEGQEHNTLDDTSAEEADVPSEQGLSKVSQKYVPPHLRSRGGSRLEEYSQIRRRVRGLLNRISESNIESITGEISAIFRSMPRIIASQIISEEVLASCSGGPRGNEQYAAVFSAFVAGMASSVGVDFSAMLMASLAKNFEDEFQKRDNLSLRNLTLLLSYLCIFGVCSSDLIYDFINILGQRLTEVDVSTILTVLQCCGMKIRADDPLSMKNFIVSVQSRVNELKASSKEGKDKIDGKRMEFMLETILDIKNNKKRSKEESSLHIRIKKWLQKLRIDDILLRGLTWSKLLNPEKKGQWWSSVENPRYDAEEVANAIDKEVLVAQKMLQLAAAQRMNTDARKAIFCIIMSSEDYIDAFEKLLRLDLPGKQAREITRVLLDCCLQEKVFNKYYVVLASKLCDHDKGHKFTLQLCIWDHYKEVESMELIRSLNLAKFVAEMVASFTLSLAVLKAVDLKDIRQLTPKRIMHFRMMFETLFECSDKVIWNVFTRAAVTPDLENLRQGIDFFFKEYLVKSKGIGANLKLVKKALTNIQGITM